MLPPVLVPRHSEFAPINFQEPTMPPNNIVFSNQGFRDQPHSPLRPFSTIPSPASAISNPYSPNGTNAGINFEFL